MTELVGDICMPKELIVPEDTASTKDPATISGAVLCISGGALHFKVATLKWQKVTSA